MELLSAFLRYGGVSGRISAGNRLEKESVGMDMSILFPFIFIPFCIQFFSFGYVKHHILRWAPFILIELLLMAGMIHHWIAPPSFDILGWEIWLWLIGSAFLGCMLAWGTHALYERKNR